MDPFAKATERQVDTGLWLDYHLSAREPAYLDVVSYEQEVPLVIDFHEGIEVGILAAGSQERSFQDFTYPVAPGDTWLCASWEPHGWRVLEPGTVAVVVVFLPAFLGDETLGGMSWLQLFASPPDRRPRVQSVEQRSRMLHFARDWEAEWRRRSPDWSVGLRFDLLRALFILSRDWAPPPLALDRGRAGPSNLAKVMPALRLVHSHPARKVNIADAAAACRLSRSQFCLVFGKVMGMSFGEFCVRARLALVAQQLLSGDASVQAIADQVGFTDASHLYRSFLKRYGCTPGEFRERGLSSAH